MTICTRSPRRDFAGIASPVLPDGINPVVVTRKDRAMPGVKLCGELHPERKDEQCHRRENHKGRHRTRRGVTWENRTPRPRYQRYVPPHRREEGAPASSKSGYRRPQSAPPSWENDDLSSVTED